MAEEFDRLDKDKKGELDAQELPRSNLLVKHARPEDMAGAWGVIKIGELSQSRRIALPKSFGSLRRGRCGGAFRSSSRAC
jgi:hypothetical protein